MIKMPIILEAYDAEPSWDGEFLDKTQVLEWARTVLDTCSGDEALHELEKLIDFISETE